MGTGLQGQERNPTEGRSTWPRNCQEEGAARQADDVLWWRAEMVVPGGASGGCCDPPVLRVGFVPGGASGGFRSRRCLTWNSRSPAEPRVVTTSRRCLTRCISVRLLPLLPPQCQAIQGTARPRHNEKNVPEEIWIGCKMLAWRLFLGIATLLIFALRFIFGPPWRRKT